MTELYERWKPIKGYEDLYEVSDWGRVRSLDRYVNYKSKLGKIYTRLEKGRLLKPSKDKDGYLLVHFFKQDKGKMFRVHRLVAEAFVENPNNYPCVNHKTECKTFNHFSALEWCDVKTNTNFGSCIERRSKKLNKKVLQYSKCGEFINEWSSINEVAKILGINQPNISHCLTGKTKTAYGFIWRYAS